MNGRYPYTRPASTAPGRVEEVEWRAGQPEPHQDGVDDAAPPQQDDHGVGADQEAGPEGEDDEEEEERSASGRRAR